MIELTKDKKHIIIKRDGTKRYAHFVPSLSIILFSYSMSLFYPYFQWTLHQNLHDIPLLFFAQISSVSGQKRSYSSPF